MTLPTLQNSQNIMNLPTLQYSQVLKICRAVGNKELDVKIHEASERWNLYVEGKVEHPPIASGVYIEPHDEERGIARLCIPPREENERFVSGIEFFIHLEGANKEQTVIYQKI